MTNIVVPLFNVTNYDKSLKINTVDGSSLPISVVGDLSSSLTDVLCLLTSSQILFLLVNWLIIIVMSISPSTIIPSFLYFPLHIILLVLELRCGINV